MYYTTILFPGKTIHRVLVQLCLRGRPRLHGWRWGGESLSQTSGELGVGEAKGSLNLSCAEGEACG